MTATRNPAADLASMTLDAATIITTQITELEAQKFQFALLWAHLHPGDQIDTTIPWEERDLEVAGDGAPTVAEFAIADFALAVGISSDAGRRLLGDAVETHHRLPRLWARVIAHEVPVWKARKIAQATTSLPIAGADEVDRALAHTAHKLSYAQLERTVEEARAKFDPQAAEDKRVAATEQRHFDIHLSDVAVDGLVDVNATMDLADALALEKTIAAKAHDLLDTFPELSLDVRRSMAAGRIGDTDGSSREVIIYAHHHPPESHGIVGIENTRSWVTLAQVVDWCQSATSRVTIRPVLDLTENLHTDSYTPTPRQREQAVLLNATCVFPHCTRPSRGLDLDHILEWARGGRTESWNLAPLCRGHHRLKTFAGWTYTRDTWTEFTWTSPRGNRYRRT